jgi:hypothetical protein
VGDGALPMLRLARPVEAASVARTSVVRLTGSHLFSQIRLIFIIIKVTSLRRPI